MAVQWTRFPVGTRVATKYRVLVSHSTLNVNPVCVDTKAIDRCRAVITNGYVNERKGVKIEAAFVVPSRDVSPPHLSERHPQKTQNVHHEAKETAEKRVLVSSAKRK